MFREILQNRLLPKAQRESKLFACLKVLSQQPTQFVGNFFAHFTTIEHQLDYEMLNWMAWYFIMIGVYFYLQKILRLKNCLGKTKLELEKNFKLIESVTPAPVGISVWETYRVSQEELTLTKAKVSWMKKKFVLGCTIDSKWRKCLIQANTPNQTVTALTLVPAWKKRSKSPTKCFQCGKFNYFAQNCKFKDAIATVVPNNLEKSEGQST